MTCLGLRLVAPVALMAVSFSPCTAEPESRARESRAQDSRVKAHVFTRQTYNGAHLGFSWDLRESVPFTIENERDRVILHFDEPVALRWGSSLKAVHPYIEQVESRDGGRTVILSMAEPSQASTDNNDGARQGPSNESGIDLVESKKPVRLMARMEAAEEETLQPESASPPAAKPHKRKWRKRKARPIASAQKTPDVAALAALAPAAGGAVSKPSPLPSAPAPAHGREAFPAKPEAAAARAAPPVAMPTAVPNPAIAPLPASAPARLAAPSSLTVPPPAALGRVIAVPVRPGDALGVFQTQKRLWIVAGEATGLTAGNLRRAGGEAAAGLETIANPAARIFSLPIPAGWSASVEKKEETLRIVTAPGEAGLARALAPELVTAANGEQSLVLPAGKASGILSFTDPATGNTVSVVTLPEVGVGLKAAKSFVKFDLLPSAQGIAVLSKSDGVSVTLQNGKAVITAPGGLALSPEAVRQFKDGQAEAALDQLPSTLFPYARWKLEDEKQFIPAQKQLYSEIAASPPEAANRARLKLLGLYLGEGLFPESLGMADDILRSSLRFYREHHVSALRAAANFFSYRIGEARRDFAVPELDNDPEAAMWRNLCDELLGEKTAPFDFAANYDRTIGHYPPAFIQKLGIIAADRSINRKEYADASGILETLKRDNHDEPVRKYIDYMRAKILSETHDEPQAQHIWEEQAKDLSDGFIRSRAEFSLINLLLKSDKLTREEAAKRLERLRIVWRGDNLELGVLRQLGDLYARQKEYAKALETMRDVVLYYPQVPEAVDTARRMEAIFVELYNKGAADDMPPLEALSLFYEFRDLVPLGKEGDQMIRNLADRLVGIDLLDRAALLLDHQVRNRLQGEDRSRVGAHLAHIYLINHQPEQALDILKTTGYGDLPPDLQLQRLRYTAQALAQQSKPDKAIAVIGADTSPEGSRLRLSIYWDNKDWPNVISIAEDILGNRNDPSAALTPPESDVLLKLATAYVYEHDTGQLQYLRDYFTPLMKNNPDRAGFLFITTESGNVDYDNLAALDQDIGAVKSFLASNPDSRGKNGMSKAAN